MIEKNQEHWYAEEMKILAIETSCDDTCIALAECKNKTFTLLSNIISSQVKLHKKYGGVYPSLAKREHQKNLGPILKEAISKTSKPKVDLIAVTKGPGLEPCLWTGINFAKALSFAWQVPVVGINHIEAHLFASFLLKAGSNFQFSIFNFQKRVFPAVALIVSGGHTQLILVKKLGQYKIIGETRDDAAGEAFDKIARILGLGYPGGPAIAATAAKTPNYKLQITNKFKIKNSKLKIQLPRPMLNTKDYDFSFSGLKTAVLYNSKKQKKLTKNYIRAMAKEAQQAIIDVLIKKTLKAARDYKVKTIILGGGVAANKELQKQFREKIKNQKLGFRFRVPGDRMATDNAAMIAFTACLGYQPPLASEKNLSAQANLRVS